MDRRVSLTIDKAIAGHASIAISINYAKVFVGDSYDVLMGALGF